ncbi:site-specific DNA-methyltransferase [Brevibacillus sp. NSP2.1]|uniref:DNA-methyltransferase n=1 Tax=Brevibacillus sp. NSP2.1 TaxID=3003229 RepID=UPI0004290A79|nr:site-specific DNA-methyltransferase [Brevibacillus sp. NSP2.1]
MAEKKLLGSIELNRIYQRDCIEGMRMIPEETIDLVVTSPPYDNLRTYNSAADLTEVGRECFRVMKDGAIMAVVIQDQTKDFGKSCTTARTIVKYVDEIGFKLFETVIWAKSGRPGAWWNKRFRVDHEYILLFLKGDRPRYFNKEPLKVPAIYAGTRFHGTTRKNNGELVGTSDNVQAEKKCRGTIWYIDPSKSEKRSIKHEHPATFPDKLVDDLLVCFSREGDIVLDPFMGSGTTAVQALKMGRNFIGFEIEREYIEIANKRLDAVHSEEATE